MARNEREESEKATEARKKVTIFGTIGVALATIAFFLIKNFAGDKKK